LIETLRAPVGTLADKLRIGALRFAATRGSGDEVWRRGDTRTTAAELAGRGFSPAMTERFLRPWLGGIFLERELETPASMLFFVYRMFAEGRAALPAGGMQRIPEQLAAGLRPGTLRFGARVVSASAGVATLADGEAMQARHVVVATEGDSAAALLPRLVRSPAWRSVTCVQWAAQASPLQSEPVLWLNGTGRGRINNVVVPSDVAADYAPAGSALVSATVLGDPAESDAELAASLREELAGHFGEQARAWRLLAAQRVRRALPALQRPDAGEHAAPVAPGLWVCGDHQASASIQGAMANGEAVARALLRQG
jgi:protoporphyrinogen oxidase